MWRPEYLWIPHAIVSNMAFKVRSLKKCIYQLLNKSRTWLKVIYRITYSCLSPELYCIQNIFSSSFVTLSPPLSPLSIFLPFNFLCHFFLFVVPTTTAIAIWSAATNCTVEVLPRSSVHNTEQWSTQWPFFHCTPLPPSHVWLQGDFLNWLPLYTWHTEHCTQILRVPQQIRS